MTLKSLLILTATLAIVAPFSASPIVAQSPKQAQRNDGAIATVTKTQGTVQLKRRNDSGYAPARANAPLFWGDSLRAKKGSVGVIRCKSDSVEWVVPDDGLPRGVANFCS